MSILRKLFVAAAASAATAVAVAKVVRSRRKIDWADKAVLVTGGSRGLGLILARRLTEAGGRVAVCARDAAELARAVAELGPTAVSFVCDVDDPEQIRRTVDDAAERFGGLDAVFNNAGRIEVGALDDQTDGDFESAMRTNFWAAYHATRAAIPHLRARGGGRIVNIASIGGKVAVPHLLPYSASKFALVGFSEGVRSELIPDNIFVTTVCPGLIRTGSPRNADFKGQADKEYAWFAASDGAPGLSMDADAVGQAVVDAAAHGDAELILPASTSFAVKLHGLMPGVTRELLTLVARLLPAPGGTRAQKGSAVDGREPAFTHAINRANAARNNQMGNDPR